VHYIRKRKAIDVLPDHHVDALDGIKFQWTAGQSPRGRFEVRFAKLEDFKKTYGTISFLGEDKTEFPKLASWTFYAKITAIKVLKKDAPNSVFTLLRIKKLIVIGPVPQYFYKYGEHSDDTTGNEQLQGDDVDDNDEEQEEPLEQEEQPCDEEQAGAEEQASVDEEQEQEQAPGDEEDSAEEAETTEDKDCKPSAAKHWKYDPFCIETCPVDHIDFWKYDPVYIGTCPVDRIDFWKYDPVYIGTCPVDRIDFWKYDPVYIGTCPVGRGCER
jgi:hypothetical protein